MSKVTVVFDSLDDFKKFLDNPKSVKFGQIVMEPTLPPEVAPSSTRFGKPVVLKALSEMGPKGTVHLPRKVAFAALKVAGLRKTKRNINNVYSALSRMVKTGELLRGEGGYYIPVENVLPAFGNNHRPIKVHSK